MKPRSTARLSFPLASAIAALLASPSVHAANGSWTGTTSGDWLTGTNWSTIPGSPTTTTNPDIATFNVAANPTIGINMNTTGGVYYLGGIDNTQNTARNIGNSSGTAGVLTLNGATINGVSNTIIRNTTGSLLTIQANQGANAAMGLELGNATNNIIQITGTGGITISSNITGAAKNLTLQGGLTGVGVLTLSGTNSYTGNTRVDAGTLRLTQAASLYNNGTAAAWSKDNLVVSSGATVVFNVGGAGEFTASNIHTLLGLSDSASNGFRSGSTVGLDTTGTVSYTNAIANPNSGNNRLSFTKLGGGTLTLEQNNTYTGSTFISAGILQLGNGGTTGKLSTSSGLLNNGTLTINRSDAVAQGTDFSAAPIIGTGALIQAGAGTTTLNAANTFTGTTTVSGGVLNLTNALALQNSAYVTTGSNGTTIGLNITNALTAGNLTLGGLSGAVDLAGAFTAGFTGSVTNLALNPQGAQSNTYSGIIANGAMTLTKTGTGTQILSGANTYTGATIVNAGTLTVGSGTTGSLNGTTGTALTFTGTGTFNVAEAAGSTQGMGELTLSAGDGTVTSTAAAATSAATLTFASLATRSAGATANFTLATNTTSTGATPNKIVLTSTTNVPLASGSNDAGIFFGGTNYARYDATGFVRAITYGTDTNANASLSGTSVATLGTIDATKDAQFVGAATTTSLGTAQAAGSSTMTVASGAAFKVGQAISGAGIAANTFVTGISGNVLTLSQVAGAITATAYTPYTSVSAQTSGFVNTLNLSGAGSSLTLDSGQTLSINGILRSAGTANVTGVISGGTGIQTATSGGEMVIRTNVANDALTIATPIVDNGTSRLTKSGAGTLLLSAANTYTGGTFLNGGTVVISNAASFGTGAVTISGSGSRINAIGGITYANDIVVNAPLVIQNPTVTAAAASTATFSGVLSGAASLSLPNSGTNAKQGIVAFTNTANTFTGDVILSASGSGDEFFSFNSIGDGGNFTIAKNGNRQGIIYAGTSDITFNTRQINIASTMNNGGTTPRQGMDGGGGNPVSLFANDGTGTVTFNTNMAMTTLSASDGVLYLSGSNTGNNTFAGIIGDPAGSVKLTIGKHGIGTWRLTGDNTYEGDTIVANGILSVGKIANTGIAQPLGIAPTIQFGVGNNGTSGTLVFTGSTNSSTDKQVVIGARLQNNGVGSGSIVNNGSGTLTFSNGTFNEALGLATVARTLTLGGSNAGANTISGTIQNNAAAAAVGLAKSGDGTWVLGGNNSFTGGVTINAGRLSLGNVGALNSTAGSENAVAFGASSTGTLTLNGNSLVVRSLNSNATPGTPVVENASATNATLTIGNSANAASTFAGVIQDGTSGTLGLIKAGTNTLTLSGTNSYGGPTNINNGTLLINGNSSTAIGNVNVNAGTLGGTGTVGGAVSVAGAAKLAPGASIESLAVGALNMAAASSFVYEVADNSSIGADLLAISTTVSLTGVTLDLTGATAALGGTGWIIGDKLTLISYLGADITSGFTGYVDNTSYFFGSNEWTFDYNDTVKGVNYATDADAVGQNRFVTMTLVPEPGVALLGGLGLLALLRRRR